MFRDLVDDLDGFSIEPDTFLDVPFVPTDDAVVRVMLNMAEVGRRDVLYDLGSGDGRIVITAAKERGTRGIGVEMDPLRVADAMEYAGDAGVEFLVDFLEEDLFEVDFSEATVVTLYLLDSVNVQLRPRLLSELRPGTRIVSHAFDMGDWQADEKRELGGISIYKWVVPAKVAGTWQWEAADGTAYRVELRQTYQHVSGKVWADGSLAELQRTWLSGKHLVLEIQGDDDAVARRFTLTFDNHELEAVQEDA